MLRKEGEYLFMSNPIKSLTTSNPNVTFFIEQLDDEYLIYVDNYGKRLDFIHYEKELDVLKKHLQFMVDAYNMGYVDGKNSALLFMN